MVRKCQQSATFFNSRGPTNVFQNVLKVFLGPIIHLMSHFPWPTGVDTRRSNATTGFARHHVMDLVFSRSYQAQPAKTTERHLRRTSLAHRSLEKLYSSWLPKLLTTPKGRPSARRSSSTFTSLRAASEPSGRFRPSMQSPSCSAKLQRHHKKHQGRQRKRVRNGTECKQDDATGVD